MGAAVLLLHVVLAVPQRALPPATFAYAVAEAAVIWAPYGVIVDAAGPCDPIAGDAMLVTVAIVNTTSRIAPRWRGPLGAIAFGPDGAPASTMMIYLSHILEFIRDAHMLGAERSRWPALHERILGRVLGRVMAHELGHYLLRMPQHTRSGLMEPVRSPDDMASPSRRGFELSALEASRLAEDGHTEKGPAWAGPRVQTTAKP